MEILPFFNQRSLMVPPDFVWAARRGSSPQKSFSVSDFLFLFFCFEEEFKKLAPVLFSKWFIDAATCGFNAAESGPVLAANLAEPIRLSRTPSCWISNVCFCWPVECGGRSLRVMASGASPAGRRPPPAPPPPARHAGTRGSGRGTAGGPGGGSCCTRCSSASSPR